MVIYHPLTGSRILPNTLPEPVKALVVNVSYSKVTDNLFSAEAPEFNGTDAIFAGNALNILVACTGTAL